MPRLLPAAIIAALFLSAAASARSIPANDVQALAWIEKRLSALEAESRDRSTPEGALRSFFKYLNNKSEIQCLSYEAAERARGDRRKAYDSIDHHIDGIRDGFFTGLPLDYFHQFKNETFDECMAGRETFAYEASGREPAGEGRVRVVVVARNTTPLTPAMKPDEYDLERRRDGFTFRFELQQVGAEWKIIQIDEKGYDGGWQPKFTPDDLKPLVPGQVWVDIL